ncbi:MAG TPA: efflux RND transporter periplasmic adaptor subunit [Terriglobia bacterium]|nr:efflux RND transporter periplasmic adaptor subunit [Terriglobia bacterium]
MKLISAEWQRRNSTGGHWRLLAAASALLALVILSTSCAENKASGDALQPAQRPPVPVLVGTVLQENIPVEINVIGSGEAYLTVNVKSLVQGEVQRVYFKGGQFVQKGDMLFSIDPSPFEAALAQAQANLAHDQAQANYAKSQNDRYTALYKSGIVSQDQYDQYRNNYAALQAMVRADQSAIQTAKLNLGYCTIRSPIDGMTGAVQIDAGNLVKVNDVAMVVINQVSPIYVDFSAPQQYLGQIKQYEARRPLRVEAVLPHEPGKPEWGTLTFINNTVDPSTGTILLKGTFPNPQRRLWPGEFVNVVLDLSIQSNAVVAPSHAIQTGQQGNYVYVIGTDHKAQYRPVTVGSVYKDETVIEKGLAPGETVVTDGQLMLYPGATVLVKTGL